MVKLMLSSARWVCIQEIMSEKNNISIQISKRVAQANAQRLADFKVSSANTVELENLLPLWGVVASKDCYSKKTSEHNQNIDIIHKNGEFAGFTWHADKNQIKEALKYGLLPTETATGLAINALGKYRCKELNRLVERGIVSNRRPQKNQILNYAQNAIATLQQLELLINSGGTIDIAKYKQELRALKTKSIQGNTPQILDEMINQCIEDQIEDFDQARFNSNRSGFIEQEIIKIVRRAQYLNQALGYQLSTCSQFPF